MFEKLDKKLKGKKYLEVRAKERDAVLEEFNEVLDAFKERVGAQGMYIYLESEIADKEGRNHERYAGVRRMSALDLISVYQHITEKIVTTFDPGTLEGLAAARVAIVNTPKGFTPGDTEYAKVTAEAMRVALDGLPEKYKAQVYKNIDMANEKIEKGDIEDVDDLLK